MKMMLMMTNTILSILLIRESNLLLDQPCWLLVINLVTLDQLHRWLINGHLSYDHCLLQNCTGRDYQRLALSLHSVLVLHDQGRISIEFRRLGNDLE